MATEPHKQEFRIRELTTRSVLLFPTRAQIIRDIKNIALQPGANQIIIDGLAPTGMLPSRDFNWQANRPIKLRY
jgi:hypothetical protein